MNQWLNHQNTKSPNHEISGAPGTYHSTPEGCILRAMGMVEVEIEIANPRLPERRARVTLLADTGATYSVIPRPLLEQVGIVPIERLEFEIADGRRIEREVGQANFLWDGRERTSVVIFGDGSDAAVLGVVTLESLGLQVDPTNKQLRPAKLILY